MSLPRTVSIVGATGSIGRSTADVIRHRPGDFRVAALAGGRDAETLLELAREFRPRAVALADPDGVGRLEQALAGSGIRVLGGDDGVLAVAGWADADLVVNGIVGAAGLRPSLAALDAGKPLALANKESLVMAGALVSSRARQRGVPILPIDSEHCSLFQCLLGRSNADVRKVVLTASGGAFRHLSLEEMDRQPPGAALAHPTWRMGRRITIDSATLMNKGFEVIEARWLFDLPPDRIDVVVHPQSVVHAVVNLTDGSALAHLSVPDMRLPIEFVLSYPEPPGSRFETLDLASVGSLEFEPPDRDRFRCLALAEAALAAGGTMPAVLNGADEIAVQAYLAGRIRFSEIASVIEETLAAHRAESGLDLSEVLEADRWARESASARVDAIADRTSIR